MVLEQLPLKRGTKLVLHRASPLLLHQTLQEQEIAGKAATLSCTYVPTNSCAAWSYAQGFAVSEEEMALEGVTQIAGNICTESLCHLPRSLEILTQTLDQVTLPCVVHSILDGSMFLSIA